ncbi:hypothetical protein [Burkholderia cepacia]|uniref:hypothetical protein n=1 Tax=Burkholderia cepacia TaxID=292 RepID=UPI00158C90AF|nr:hypothetical protein [Burkholderia cepacia]MCA7894923.1 hypothetical protein [Burkholderia cepacia]
MQNGRLSAMRPAESASTDTAAPAAGVFPDRLFIARFTPDIAACRFSSGLIQHRFPGTNDAMRQYSGAAIAPAFTVKSGHIYR